MSGSFPVAVSSGHYDHHGPSSQESQCGLPHTRNNDALSEVARDISSIKQNMSPYPPAALMQNSQHPFLTSFANPNTFPQTHHEMSSMPPELFAVHHGFISAHQDVAKTNGDVNVIAMLQQRGPLSLTENRAAVQFLRRLTQAGEANTYIDWLDQLWARLEPEARPEFANPDGAMLPEEKGEWTDMAWMLRRDIDITLDEIHDQMERDPKLLDKLIKNKRVARSILFAAPRGAFRTDDDMKLIEKLDRNASTAKDDFYHKTQKYIDELWQAKPETMQKSWKEVYHA